MKAALLAAATMIAATTASPCLAADPASQSNDLRVARDKDTGQLREPTADEQKALAAAEKNDAKSVGPAKVELRTLTDGTRAAVLTEAYSTSIVATRGADGKITYSHSKGQPDQPIAKQAEE